MGVGPSGLLRIRLGKRAALLGDARWHLLPGASPRETYDLRGQIRLHVATGLSVALEARRTPAADEGTAVMLGYF